jgi:hypothetical protein
MPLTDAEREAEELAAVAQLAAAKAARLRIGRVDVPNEYRPAPRRPPAQPVDIVGKALAELGAESSTIRLSDSERIQTLNDAVGITTAAELEAKADTQPSVVAAAGIPAPGEDRVITRPEAASLLAAHDTRT